MSGMTQHTDSGSSGALAGYAACGIVLGLRGLACMVPLIAQRQERAPFDMRARWKRFKNIHQLDKATGEGSGGAAVQESHITVLSQP
jgi:hypothetical protein